MIQNIRYVQKHISIVDCCEPVTDVSLETVLVLPHKSKNYAISKFSVAKVTTEGQGCKSVDFYRVPKVQCLQGVQILHVAF